MLLDRETGEINYNFHVSENAETGEAEYLTFCVDEETGENNYINIDTILGSFQINNPFKISRYSTNINTIIEQPNHKNSKKCGDFFTAIIFLLPSFIFFSPILGICLSLFDLLLHKYSHWKNSKLGQNSTIYYQSPMHMITREFCAQCRSKDESDKINHIQNLRKNKRFLMSESFRRAVAS